MESPFLRCEIRPISKRTPLVEQDSEGWFVGKWILRQINEFLETAPKGLFAVLFWVFADSHNSLPQGEALVRPVLHGCVECRVCDGYVAGCRNHPPNVQGVSIP
jgi:hypothetical protein